jgi:hypothetical protein
MHPTVTAFLAPLAPALRFCQHVTGFDGQYETLCGAQMHVCYDERPKVEGPIIESASEEDKRIQVSKAIRQAQKNLLDGLMSPSEIVTALGIGLRGIKGKERNEAQRDQKKVARW